MRRDFVPRSAEKSLAHNSRLGLSRLLDLEMGESGDTTWVRHLGTPLDQTEIRFRPDGKWWERTARFYEALKEELGDSALIAAPTLTAGLDALAAFRTNMELLYDLVDCPDAVHDAMRRVNGAYSQVFAATAKLFEFDKYGSVNRHGMYQVGAIGVPQCDFSCMISEEMFDEFAAPCIEHEMSVLDAVEYHLDGPGAIRHLPRLAQMPKLDVVQWAAGAGAAAERDWTDLYRDVVARGKGLILGGSRDGILRQCREHKSRALFFNGWFATRAQAEDCIAEVERMYATGQ